MTASLSRPTESRGYFAAVRAPRYSIVFALPLLVAYEGLAALVSPGGGMRNGADALFRGFFSMVAGSRGPAVFMAAVILLGIYLVARDMKGAADSIKPRYFFGMMAESTVLAILFGIVIGTLTAQLLGAAHLLSISPQRDVATMSWATRLMLSLGAGLYEELFFRVVLVSGFAALGRAAFGFSQRGAAALAIISSAILFSLFHYIGPYGEPLQLGSFTFRLLSGLAFSGLYVARGFGITAWTHALYDAFILVF